MRQIGAPDPVASFPLPAFADEYVADELAEFHRVADLAVDAHDERKARERAIAEGEAADIRAIVAANAAGEDLPKNPQAHEQKARAELERALVLERGHKASLDSTGNRLAAAVEATREPWIARLEELELDAADRFRESLTELRQALADVILARSGAEYLRAFRAVDAQQGKTTGFPGGRARVKARLSGDAHDPRALLDAVARVVDETREVARA